jgi:hypothetical protein
MIKFKEKLYVIGGLVNGAMLASIPIGMVQTHAQGQQAEEAAEEQARLQRKMNAQLKRIADSEDQNKGQEAAAVLQGQQAFSELSQDVGEDLSNGVKKAGNTVGGAVGGLTGAATGAVGGALAGKAAVAASNKFLGTTLSKGGRYGALAGTVMGGILGTQSGSSLFSERKGRVGSVLYSDINLTKSDIDSLARNSEKLQSIRKPGLPSQSVLASDLEQVTQRSFAAPGEIMKAGKGLWNVAMQHKGTLAKNIGVGAAMGLTGYGINKLANSDEEKGNSAKSTLTKIGLGTLGAVATGMALKKGVNYKLLGKGLGPNTTSGKVVKGVGSALTEGAGFGALIGGLPVAMKAMQENKMKEDTGGDNGDSTGKNGSSIGKKILTGTAIAAGTALGGYKLAKMGMLTKPLQKKAMGLSESIAKRTEPMKENILRKLGSEESVQARQDYLKSLEAKKNQASSVMTDPKTGKPVKTWMGEATNWNGATDGVVNQVTGILGGSGKAKTEGLIKDLKAQDSQYLQKTADWLKGHKKTAMAAAAIPGYAVTMGAWGLGEDMVKKPLKKLDPDAYKNEEEEE